MALNPTLYARLKTAFRRVSVGNEGERTVAGRPVIDFATGKAKSGYENFGEYYKVDCPFCGDKAQRLWINYLWETTDSTIGMNRSNLAICYNDGCLRTHYRELVERIFGAQNGLTRRGRRLAIDAEPIFEDDSVVLTREIPGTVISVAKLKQHHAARAYLESRGFDIRELATRWEVSWCKQAKAEYLLAHDRIIAPVYFESRLVGWQGRYVGDINWKQAGLPKYYTCPGFKKTKMLYNYDIAAEGGVVVCVEGITDVWATGPRAVALLGKTVNPRQRSLLSRWAQKGLCILMLDPTAWREDKQSSVAERERKRAKLLGNLSNDFNGRFVEVSLPEDRDPGQFDRDVLWAEIKKACRASGIRLKSFMSSYEE